MMYAQNAISVNEFHGHSWNKVILDFKSSLISANAHVAYTCYVL